MRITARMIVPWRQNGWLAPLLGAALFVAGTGYSRAADGPAASVERGRYLVQTAGCNDCHSPGYLQADGKSPEASWLTGSDLGWRGPWGTTYAVNLRLLVADLTEGDWLERIAKLTPRPPMPWFNLRAMTEDDLKSIYRYIKTAGPAGQAMPAYLPPGQNPTGPFVQFP